jgi:hypothetical protein
MRFSITIRRGTVSRRWDFGTKDDLQTVNVGLLRVLMEFELLEGDEIIIGPGA